MTRTTRAKRSDRKLNRLHEQFSGWRTPAKSQAHKPDPTNEPMLFCFPSRKWIMFPPAICFLVVALFKRERGGVGSFGGTVRNKGSGSASLVRAKKQTSSDNGISDASLKNALSYSSTTTTTTSTTTTTPATSTIATTTTSSTAATTTTTALPTTTSIGALAGAALPKEITTEQLQKLQTDYQNARATMWERIQLDYGTEYASDLFLEPGASERSIGRLFLGHSREAESSPHSWNYLVERLALKLIESLISNNNHNDGEEATTAPKFVWATQGHSVTAGHGNFYKDAYANVMERRVSSLFSAVGINFVNRMYAMGGTASGPEIALCGPAIFGTDVDVLTWDTAMTDGSNTDWLGSLAVKSFLHMDTRPIILALHPGLKPLQPVADLDAIGVPILCHNETTYKYIHSQIPDTASRTTQAEIDELPPLLRYFRCGNKEESGDMCNENKWNKTFCSERKYKVKWHTGFKWHALEGTVQSLAVADAMEDAIQLLLAQPPTSLASLYQKLQDNIQQQYRRVSSLTKASPQSSSSSSSFWPEWLELLTTTDGKRYIQVPDGLNLDIVLKGATVCHTARLPSEIRYRNIITADDPTDEAVDAVAVTDVESTTNIHYEKGYPFVHRSMAANPSSEMRLAYTPEDRQKCDEELIQIDFKDYFLVQQVDGWQEITLPQKSYVEHYKLDSTQLQGYVAICFPFCPFFQCEKYVFNAEAFVGLPASDKHPGVEAGTAQMEINGVSVTNMTKWGNDCYWLHHQDGSQFAAASTADGDKFTLKAKIDAPGGILRFSTFLIF